VKSLSKIIGANLSVMALLATIIITTGCDDTVWNKVNTPTESLLLVGQVLAKQHNFLVTVTTMGITGTWSGLGVNIDGHAFTLSSTDLPTFILSTSSDTISSVTVSQSPSSYSCSVTSFTPSYWFYTLNIMVQCNTL
jgi:hypothetical protein